MLFALAVVFNFIIGGVTGIHLPDVPTDLSLSDTYFVVAHFHYTIIGAEIFALVGAIYYWYPKVTGRMYELAFLRCRLGVLLPGALPGRLYLRGRLGY